MPSSKSSATSSGMLCRLTQRKKCAAARAAGLGVMSSDTGTMIDVVLGAAASVVVGLALWLLLPRGVVLTRSFPATEADGSVLLDTWRIRNESPIPARIRSVAVCGAFSYDDSLGEIRWIELGNEQDTHSPATLRLDNEVAEVRRVEARLAWRSITVAPGDTMTAHLLNNTTLRIRYRRAGPFGLVERREIQLHGVA